MTISHSIKKLILKLRRHPGMNDLLTYLILLDPQTVLHKDGALSRHYLYVGPDLLSGSDQEFEYHAETWKNSFNFLGNGWMVETNVLSQLSDDQRIPPNCREITSALIDDERRLRYENGHYFHSFYYLSLTWKPENKLGSTFERFAVDTEEEQSTEFSDRLKQFNRLTHEYISYLQRSLMRIEALSGDALMTFLHRCLSGENTKLVQPSMGTFLDCYLSQDFVAGFEPRVAEKSIRILNIDDVPIRAYPAMLDTVSEFPISYRWSSRFVTLDALTARQYLKQYERSWSSKAIGVIGVLRESLGMPTRLDRDAEQMAEQCREAQVMNSLILPRINRHCYLTN